MTKQAKTILGMIGLLLVVPAMELWQLFPYMVEFHPYPANPDKSEWVRWYVKDVSWRVFMVAISLFLWLRERTRRDGYPEIAVIIPLYFGLDFLMYLLNHSSPGVLYFIVYGPIVIYVAYNTFKKQAWDCGEWIYSQWQKIKRNGNNRRNP